MPVHLELLRLGEETMQAFGGGHPYQFAGILERHAHIIAAQGTGTLGIAAEASAFSRVRVEQAQPAV